jgi:N-methylhydantoinase B
MQSTVDPFTFEIIRHKLFRVTEEASVALENVSGTSNTAEGHDLMVSLYRANGGLMVGGAGFLQHIVSASQAVKHILARYAEDPGIFQDDVYLFNDPYSGALHAPDVYLITPIHWQGTLAGFVADFVHVTDIGGIDPGGFCPRARSSFEEGFASQGIKLVERGKLRRDVFDTILNVVRDPGMVGLDLKSLLAASHVAKERVLALYRDYTYEAVDAVSSALIAQSETLFRQRLAELPEGVWRARCYHEQPEQIMRVELTATKQRDTMTFDFTGTDGQVSTGINCSYWATWGAVFAPLFPMLAHDMVWNDGVLAPIQLIAPEGSLVNARRPAPVSMATIGMVQIVRNLALTVLSKMVGASEQHKHRASAVWAPTNMSSRLTGLSARGEYLVHQGADSFAGSGGARAFKDGVDLGGQLHALASRWANAERNEASFPHRYLYRRLVPDSGGPGKYRGGVCHEFAVVPHGGAEEHFTAILMPGRGMEVPQAFGTFGGYPGCNTASTQFRAGNAAAFPSDLASTVSERQDQVNLGVTEIDAEDILYIRYDGGGGYGDPLEREPEAVLQDVLQGLVTAGPAREVYGVVLDLENGRVDRAATEAQRLALRQARLGGKQLPPEVTGRGDIPRTGRRINEYLQLASVGDGAFVQCTWCGTKLCAAEGAWKDHVTVRKSPPSIAGPLRAESSRFSLLEFFCPECATALDVDVAFMDDPPLHDCIYRWADEPERLVGSGTVTSRRL